MALEVAAERRLFTRAEYHRMGEVGIFTEDDRVELIKGEIVKMSPIGRHQLLLIEVAETSLRYDRVTKRPLYAEAGVPEYWIVDCSAESVELHRGPAVGGYRDVTRVTGATDSVSLQAFPDVALGLAEIFS